ncbi:hypothetical protein [Ornithinimicrobium flavum]|uniref:hypothetical protein n=1 Tax=Ornithinimicrobium flavum TaxID=1288636 RepID=UPI00106F921A|nr:hypothetical protein [Ornithinimicrobium flavum]
MSGAGGAHPDGGADGRHDEQVLDGAHPHGYLLVGPGVAPPPDVAGWPTRADLVPGATLHLQPRTVLSCERGATGTVILLGHPVDVGAGITDGHRIASRLVGTWDLRGDDALVREAAGLGGRWTLLAVSARGPEGPVHGSDLLVVPDTHATQPVFHAVAAGRLGLGSTPALVAAALGLPVDERALALLAELRELRRGAVTYLPGRLTPYAGLDPLLPNLLLRVDLGDRPGLRRERFWPWHERVGTDDVAAVHAAFRERLTAHTELLAGLGRPAVSLTAGTDSRVTAAVARHTLRARDGFAFTYVNPRDARNGRAALADVTAASAVAARLGLPHRVLRWRAPAEGGTFDRLHRRTYAPLVPSRGAAHAMWADLPRDLVQLQSNCAETGTTFYRRRTAEPLSSLRLTRIMMNATEGYEDLADDLFGGYLDFASLTPDRLLGHDHHDLLYWEQRIGRWGWQKFTDGDLGHRILLPFNDRVLLETMLSLPYPLREGKVLLERILTEVPAARVPARSAPLGESVARSVTGRLPGRLGRAAGRRIERAVTGRARRSDHERLAWARGYALLPPPELPVPAGWAQVALPGQLLTLVTHPRLPHAVREAGRSWVLVLGEPAWVEEGLVGAGPVAERLGTMLATVSLHDVQAAAATLAGSWVVALSTPGRSAVITDPLVSLGGHLTPDGRGVVSHATLAGTDPTADPGAGSVSSDELLAASGPLGLGLLSRVPLGAAVDLPERAGEAASSGLTRGERLRRHVALLHRRGPAWLGLADDPGSTRLLELLGQARGEGAPPVTALTWWDRLAPDRVAQTVFTAGGLATRQGVPHHVVGLREDVDGTDSPAGRAARAAALDALATTWGPAVSRTTPEGAELLPLGDAIDQVVPRAGVLWLGATPRSPRALGTPGGAHDTDRPAVRDLVQGVRPLALPLSDRLLDLLPEG